MKAPLFVHLFRVLRATVDTLLKHENKAKAAAHRAIEEAHEHAEANADARLAYAKDFVQRETEAVKLAKAAALDKKASLKNKLSR